MLSLVQTLGWVACVIYATIPSFWLLIHPHAAFWRSRLRNPYRVLIPAWVAMWIVVGLATAPWRNVALYTIPWIWIPAILLFAIGIWIYSRAKVNFGPAQLGGLPEILPNHRDQALVTTGIRAHIRHPVYLGHLCEMLAWSLGTGLAVLYLLTVFAIATGAIMIRMEDAELEQRFGTDYLSYRRQVPAVLPRWR